MKMKSVLFLPLIFLGVFAIVKRGPCDNIEITETTTPSKVIYLGRFGEDEQVAYAATDEWKFFRSPDSGRTWVDQTPFWRNSYGDHAVGIAPTADDRKMYFIGNGPDYPIWTTIDTGLSYQYQPAGSNFSLGVALQFIMPHPKIPLWALGAGYSLKHFDGNAPGYQHFDLFYTMDLGESWHLVESYIQPYSLAWGRFDEERAYFYYTVSKNKTGDEDYYSQHWILKQGNFYNMPNGLEILPDVRFVFNSPVSTNYELIFTETVNANGAKLIISEDNGITFVEATFPHPILQSFSVLDDSEGSISINVQHEVNANYGNLYTSNAFGTQFSLSLRNNIRMPSKNGEWDQYPVGDFTRMAKPIRGIYVANYYDDQFVTSGSPIKSVITYDAGSDWVPIPAPSMDSNGNSYNCTDCSLHLWGMLEQLWVHPGFYSVPGAIGIMLGTGNVGKNLTLDKTKVSTFMSRDAGHSWIEVDKGMHIYEIADVGSLIIFANKLNKTNDFIYTWDEGLTFTECQFTSGEVSVENIVADPIFTKEQFIIYGARSDETGFIIHLDFSGLHERTCEGARTPGTPDSDYELWQLQGTNNATCQFGKQTTFIRRKQNATCFNPEDYQPVSQSISCLCTRDDYECDYCFERQSDGSCGIACDNYDPSAVPENCVNEYYISQGYRLVVGDTCDVERGLNLLPVKTACPDKPPSGKTAGAIGIIATLLLLVIGSGVIVSVVAKKTGKPAMIANWLNKFGKSSSSSRESGSYARLTTFDDDE